MSSKWDSIRLKTRNVASELSSGSVLRIDGPALELFDQLVKAEEWRAAATDHEARHVVIEALSAVYRAQLTMPQSMRPERLALLVTMGRLGALTRLALQDPGLDPWRDLETLAIEGGYPSPLAAFRPADDRLEELRARTRRMSLEVRRMSGAAP